MDYFLTTLQHLYDKRAQLNKLIFYRNQYGVTTKTGLKIAENHNKGDCKTERVEVRNLITHSTIKKNRSPVDIFHLPRYIVR